MDRREAAGPDEDGHGDVQGSDKLLAAIKTIIVADLVMSVDNVIAIAGAAQNAGDHSFLLVVLGLLISIPIIVWGSQLVIKLMERFRSSSPSAACCWAGLLAACWSPTLRS